MCHCRAVDRFQRQLSQCIGILEILVTEVFHCPGRLAVHLDHVLGNSCRDIEGKVPGHRHQQVVDPYHWVLETVLGRLLRVVHLLGYATTTDTVAAANIDHS
jgi:hypothetical protein